MGTRTSHPQKLMQRDARARPWQIDSPYVVKWHSGQKRMNTQRQAFELLS
jgi:hypothetical protein